MLNGKTALITGANGGIGNEIAKVFLENGALVIANYRNDKKEIEKLREKHGDKILAVRADISKSAEVKEMFSIVREKFGKLDILVNSAGILKDNLLLMVQESEWDEVLGANLKGSFLCMQQAAKMMMKDGGSIINISSLIGLEGNSGQTVYAASKAGIIGLTKSASKELGQFNIRVNAVAPGLIQTGMVENLKEEVFEDAVENSSLGRIGMPEDVAGVVIFLASSESGFITGQTISVDGGWVI